jgi:hypothetical protein
VKHCNMPCDVYDNMPKHVWVSLKQGGTPSEDKRLMFLIWSVHFISTRVCPLCFMVTVYYQ